MEKNQGLKSVLAVILGLIAGSLLMLAMGFDPVKGYEFLFKGGLKSIERIGNTIATATPLILTGLSVAFAFRTGLFNIGAPGQMLFGGFCAVAVGLSFSLPTIIIVPLMVIAGKFGTGATRKKNIESLGYDYNAVQKKVNELLKQKNKVTTGKTSRDVAVEVIRGKWGNGKAREKALTDAGYNAKEVQMYVNMLCK